MLKGIYLFPGVNNIYTLSILHKIANRCFRLCKACQYFGKALNCAPANQEHNLALFTNTRFFFSLLYLIPNGDKSSLPLVVGQATLTTH